MNSSLIHLKRGDVEGRQMESSPSVFGVMLRGIKSYSLSRLAQWFTAVMSCGAGRNQVLDAAS